MSPLVSTLRSRERSHRPTLRIVGSREWTAGARLSGKPEPRPLDAGPGGVDGRDARAAVLLAGADAGRRASLRLELGAELPARTRFCEADEITEVLEHAPQSSMVILTGDLDDADGESLLRLLGRRHPQLPVIRVEEPAPAPAGGRD